MFFMNAMRTSNTFDFLKFILEFKNDLVKNDQGAPTQIQEPLKSVHSCMVTGQDIDLSVWTNSWTSACNNTWPRSERVQMTACEEVNLTKRLCRFADFQEKREKHN